MCLRVRKTVIINIKSFKEIIAFYMIIENKGYIS